MSSSSPPAPDGPRHQRNGWGVGILRMAQEVLDTVMDFDSQEDARKCIAEFHRNGRMTRALGPRALRLLMEARRREEGEVAPSPPRVFSSTFGDTSQSVNPSPDNTSGRNVAMCLSSEETFLFDHDRMSSMSYCAFQVDDGPVVGHSLHWQSHQLRPKILFEAGSYQNFGVSRFMVNLPWEQSAYAHLYDGIVSTVNRPDRCAEITFFANGEHGPLQVTDLRVSELGDDIAALPQDIIDRITHSDMRQIRRISFKAYSAITRGWNESLLESAYGVTAVEHLRPLFTSTHERRIMVWFEIRARSIDHFYRTTLQYFNATIERY